MKHQKTHILTILLLGSSAGLWCILETRFLMPVVWLCVLTLYILWTNLREWKKLISRLFQVALTLVFITMLQIVFRREGEVLVFLGRFPLIYSRGLNEAVLLWIRYMILFMSATLFLQKPSFQVITFFNRLGFPMRLCLLLLTALRMIPLIFNEAKQILFFLRFRGIRFTSLSITQKIKASKQLMYTLLMRGMDTVFYSGYILEVRGFGVDKADRLSNRNPIHAADIALIGVILTLNAVGLFIRLDFPV